MSIAQQLNLFIQQHADQVFIEAEGKPSRLNTFISNYNALYRPQITSQDNGIICLEENANKWGLELRLYLHFKPSFIPTTNNRVYRPEYPFRINDVDIINEMFALGYRIGQN